MSRFNVIFTKRKIAIGSGVAALLLAAVGCSYLFFNDTHSSEDPVNVSIASDKQPLPENKAAFANSLPKGVTGVILISQSKNQSDGPVITAISPKGEAINLCAASAAKPECTLTTTASALAYIVSGTAEDFGTCENGARQCHTAGPNKDKWHWHKSPDKRTHFKCPDACQ